MLVEGDLIAGHDIQRAVWTGGNVVPGEWSLDLAALDRIFGGLGGFSETVECGGPHAAQPHQHLGVLMDRLDVSIPPTFWYELRVP